MKSRPCKRLRSTTVRTRFFDFSGFSACIGQKCSLYVQDSEFGRFQDPSFRFDLKIEYHAKTYRGARALPWMAYGWRAGGGSASSLLVCTQVTLKVTEIFAVSSQCDGSRNEFCTAPGREKESVKHPSSVSPSHAKNCINWFFFRIWLRNCHLIIDECHLGLGTGSSSTICAVSRLLGRLAVQT